MDYNKKHLKRKKFIRDSTRKILEKMKGMANGIFYWIKFVVWFLESDIETEYAQRSVWPDEIHSRYSTGNHLKINKKHELVAVYVQPGESYNYFTRNMYMIKPGACKSLS